MRESYPLQWPEGWARSNASRSRFKVASFVQVRDRVLSQLRMLGGANRVITSNLPVRLDGLPYAYAAEPADRGVAVYWVEAGRERVIACDRWRNVRDNLHAIELSLDALRGLARWGTSSIVERAFAGFAALPPAAPEWRIVFGLASAASMEDVDVVYRLLARTAHPDRGGSHEAMQRLNAARAAARAELEGR